MLIIPKSLASRYAPDMKGLVWDSKELSLICESSFTWRSKFMHAKYWSNLWKREKSMLPRSGLILKPCEERICMERWMSSLLVSPVSRFQMQVKSKERATNGISGRISKNLSEKSNQRASFLKTCRASYRRKQSYIVRSSLNIVSDLHSAWEHTGGLLSMPDSAGMLEYRFSNMYFGDWKSWVINARQDYSARLRSALLTSASESLSWGTPTSRDWKDGTAEACKNVLTNKLLGREVHQGGTPRVTTNGGCPSPQCTGKGSRLEDQVATWPTPHANCSTGSGSQGREGGENLQTTVGRQDQDKSNSTGRNRESFKLWGTHTVGSVDGSGKRSAKWIKGKSPNPQEYAKSQNKKLNADWVEQLQGLPVGWTQLSGAKPGENRVDRLRLLGNGVVPQTAEKAFLVLWEKLKNPQDIQQNFEDYL